MTRHEDLQRSLGSYVFGALEPAERAALEEHLTGCAACREELASYAGLPGLLSRLSLEEATGSALVPAPSLLPRLLAAVERERDRGARRLRRWQAATAAAGIAAVAAVAAAVLAVAPVGADAQRAGRSLVAEAGLSASGQVVLEPRPWGTAVALRVQGLPRASSYTAWAVDAAGRRSVVATWGPTRDGAAEVRGATALPPAELRSLTVSADDGRPLLTLAT